MNNEELEKEQIEKISNSKTLQELNNVKSELLGKKSKIAELYSKMKDLAKDEKIKLGKILNQIKNNIEEAFTKKKEELEKGEINKKLLQDMVDITLPSKYSLGSIHPIEKIIDEEIKIFEEMGYSVVEGPEIEKTSIIFDKLNTPLDHPARELQDTFYIDLETVLRSQTSGIQIRTMEKEDLPIKIICPGAVYRADSLDATHSPVFHQMEGLVVGKNITMSDLFGTLEYFAKRSLGKDTIIRFRPHHFPYTEPSAEVDVSCFVCKGKGCNVCKKEGWIELLGCGMVHRNVLKNCGIDPDVYSGFAFGFGIERIAMAKFGINDLRKFYENDIRFLNQFK